jgi:hypothetical protein
MDPNLIAWWCWGLTRDCEALAGHVAGVRRRKVHPGTLMEAGQVPTFDDIAVSVLHLEGDASSQYRLWRIVR